jgi:hypothetical protein
VKFPFPIRTIPKVEEKNIVLHAALHPDPAVLDILQQHPNILVREAYSVQGALQNLQNVQLVIIDSLYTTPDTSIDLLQQILDGNHIPHISQQDFLARPEEWLSQVQITETRSIHFLPPRQVNLVNWAGGVGKTTLALAMARRFVEQTGLPTVLIELSLGPGSLQVLTSIPLPDFFDIFTRKAEPGTWQGVKMIPMDGRAFEVAWTDDRAGVLNFFQEVRRQHILTVVDGHPAHPLFSEILAPSHGSISLVISTPRPDTLHQGRCLFQGLPDPKYWIVNQSNSVVDSVEEGITLRLPFRESWAASMDPHLADPLLALLYQGWSGKSHSR